jgi:hypothetical protein
MNTNVTVACKDGWGEEWALIYMDGWGEWTLTW